MLLEDPDLSTVLTVKVIWQSSNCAEEVLFRSVDWARPYIMLHRVKRKLARRFNITWPIDIYRRINDQYVEVTGVSPGVELFFLA